MLETSASASAVSGHQFANEVMILTLQGGSCKCDVGPSVWVNIPTERLESGSVMMLMKASLTWLVRTIQTDVSFTDLPSIRTIRRVFNFFANSHIAPTTINTISNTEEVTIRDLYEELLLSTKPVDLSTARGMDDS